jgi:putative transposase
MTRPCSGDLRDRAVVRVEAGQSVRTVAAALDIGVATVVRWAQRYRVTGAVAPGKIGGHGVPVLSGHRDWLIERTL